MSFYSYKNANASCCPGMIAGDATTGLQEKVCVQVKRVYDSALWQEQIDNAVVTITSYAQVNNCGCGGNAFGRARKDAFQKPQANRDYSHIHRRAQYLLYSGRRRLV